VSCDSICSDSRTRCADGPGLARHELAGLKVRSPPDVPAAGDLRRLESCISLSMDEIAGLLPSWCVETVHGWPSCRRPCLRLERATCHQTLM
jgi:hypothetical protein